MNVRAAFIHVLGDFLQSIGVFIAALLIWFKVSFIPILKEVCHGDFADFWSKLF